MQCELCGRESKGCREASVDGVSMMLCPDCIQYGENVVPKTSAKVKSFISRQVKKKTSKDIYDGMEKELVSNWNDVIKEARKKKGFSREDLGFKIGERTVTISKIENGDLRPTDKIIKKLEKELDICLMEEVKKITTSGHIQSKMTLGDFIKKEN
jgi:putative transcription factor